MKTVDEVRRERLRMLREEVGGRLSDLNRRTDKSSTDATYSQILNSSPDSKTKKPKEMGSDLARNLEEKMGKPRGWMDTDPAFDAYEWPFKRIDESKVRALDRDRLIVVETHFIAETRRIFDIDVARDAKKVG